MVVEAEMTLNQGSSTISTVYIAVNSDRGKVTSKYMEHDKYSTVGVNVSCLAARLLVLTNTLQEDSKVSLFQNNLLVSCIKTVDESKSVFFLV